MGKGSLVSFRKVDICATYYFCPHGPLLFILYASVSSEESLRVTFDFISFFFFFWFYASAKDVKVGEVRLCRGGFEEYRGSLGQASLGALVLIC